MNRSYITSAITKILCIVAFFISSTTVKAQDVLMSWDFVWITSNDSIVTAEADFFATNISTIAPSGVIRRGADLSVSKNSGRFNASGWSTQTSPEDHRYMEIDISPENGYQINLDSIVFNFQRNSNGPKYLAIRSSEDGYTSDLAVFDSIGTSNNGLKAVLSGFISITNNVTFRFYGYNANYETGNGGFEGTGDDIIIYGSVESAINFDTEIQAPVSQIPGDTISTHRNIESLAKDVFTFNVADQGTTDGQPTIITNIRVVPNVTNTADWTDHIQGVTLNDGSPVTIGTPVITDTYIDIPVPVGNLNIADGTNQDVTLGIYFNPTNLIEGEILSFMIDASDHGCTADASGSQFAPTFAGGDFNSANFSVEVVPTKITITVQPSLVVVNRIMSPAVVAGFSDDNGNIDLDAQTEEIRVAASGVTLSGSSNTIGEIQSDGLTYFSDLVFTDAGSGTLTFDDVNGYAGSIPNEVSDAFDVIGASESIVIAEGSSEASGISSIVNDAPITDNTEGVQIWQFRLYDGDGTLSDNDGLPTNYTKIRITKGTGNTVPDWSAAIEDIQFFADASSTPIAGTITAYNDSILFIPTGSISVPQGAGSNVLISMRLSLANPLPSGSDGQQFVFEILDTNVLTSNGYTSSNPGVFTVTSDNTPAVNTIDVTGTEVRYQQQPTDVTVSQNIDPAVVVSLTDANGNIDLGFETSIIQITSTGSTLNNSPVDQAIDASGLATFGSIQLMDVASGVTLTATDRDNVMGLGSPAFVVSDPFNVTPSSSSVVQAVALSEPDTVSSMNNIPAITTDLEGEQVWAFNLFDGNGTDDDEDDLPTIYTGFTITQSTNNSVPDWASTLLAVSFFNGSTLVDGTINVTVNSIEFTPTTPISVPDGAGSSNTIYMRVSVQSSLPTGSDDNQNFVFELDESNVVVQSGNTSSQLGTFILGSDITKNKLEITPTHLLFVQQPSDVQQYQIMTPGVGVAFTDANNNIAFDYINDEISLTSNGAELNGGEAFADVNETNAIATFDALSFNTYDSTTTLTASDPLSVSRPISITVSDEFMVWAAADHLEFVSFPTTGLVSQNIGTFTIEALRSDRSVDTYFNSDISISINTGTGNLVGTLVQTAVDGVATFDDISFDNTGNFTLLASSATTDDQISENISIVGNESIFTETMGTVAGTTTIAAHDGASGFDYSGTYTYSDGGAASPAVVDNINPSTGSGAANILFDATTTEYGFSIENVYLASYTGLSLDFLVRKEDGAGIDFAAFAVDYWNGSSWNSVTLTGLPTNSDPAGWYSVSATLPVGAQVADFGIRFVKTGSIGCRIDDVSISGTPNPPTQLAVIDVNGGTTPVAGEPFTITLQSQDSYSNPANVIGNTDVVLVLETGSGLLSGTLTGTFTTGTNELIISGVTYDTGETGVSITGSRTSGDNLADGTSSPFTVLAAEPLISTSNINFSSISATGMTVNWTNGDGAERIVLAKQGSAVDAVPVDGTVYTPNTEFGLGEEIGVGSGNYVVYAGNQSSVAVTGLIADETEYHYAVFEYNGSATTTNYKQTDPGTGSQTTGCTVPLTQASGLTFSNITMSRITVNWADGDGTGRLVKINTTNSFSDPVDGVEYTADASWNGAGEQVVYVGPGSSATITNLSSATTYWIKVYELKCSGTLTVYKTDVDNAASTQTILLSQYFTSCPAPGWTSVLIRGNAWQCDAGGYAVASGIGSAVNTETWYISPVLDFDVLSDEKLSFNSWTSGTDDTHPKMSVLYSTDYSGSGNPNVATWTEVVYNVPVENSQTWTPSGDIDLSLVTSTGYIAFKYNSSGNVAGSATEWRIDNVVIIDQACSTPSVIASNMNFTNVNINSMTVNWTNGDGIGRIVIAREGSAVDFIPVDGTEYAANPDYTAGTDLGNGNKVVYNGSLDNVNVTGLLDNTTYHYAIYEYNCTGTNITYSSSALTGSQTTVNNQLSDIVTMNTTDYSYTQNIDYTLYNVSSVLSTANSMGVFGLTLRDGGALGSTDSNPTTLNTITFSTNGSTAIRSAALFVGTTNVAEITGIDGGTSFQFSGISGISALDGDTLDFELRVTFQDIVTDNEQIVFTVTEASSTGTAFAFADAGGAESPATLDYNRIEVDATVLTYLVEPVFSIAINRDFSIEVQAADVNGSIDLDATITMSTTGTGTLSSGSGLSQPTTAGSALWTDLQYDTEETIQLQAAYGVLTVNTADIIAKERINLFTFTGSSGDEASFAPDEAPVSVTVNSISRGSSLVPELASDAFSASGWPTTGLTDTTDYFYQVRITTDPNHAFTINTIEVDESRTAGGPLQWQVRSSVDDFNSTIDQVFVIPDNTDTRANQEVTFGTAVQNVTDVILRIYGHSAEASGDSWTIDNLEIYGNVVETDIPQFTTGYPQYDSVAIGGFDLLVNLSKEADAYYVIQLPSVPVPSASQVVNGLNGDGLSADASGTIAVSAGSTTVIERVSGLSSDTNYNVYWILRDAFLNQSAVIEQAGIPTSDTDSYLSAAAQPPTASNFPSWRDTSVEADSVFNVIIGDMGTNDGAPTNVTRLKLVPGPNNEADWFKAIGGLLLWNVTESYYVTTGTIEVFTDSLLVDIVGNSLSIADGTEEKITMLLWLNPNDTIDDAQAFEFQVGGADHGFETYAIGSQFGASLTELVSNTYTTDVTATRLLITEYTNPMSVSTPYAFTVKAVDANGNLDPDVTSDVSLSLILGSGALNSTLDGLTKAMTAGEVSWSDLEYDTDNEYIQIVASHASLTDDTTDVITVGNPENLIVNSDLTLYDDLVVPGYVLINDPATLTLSNGITLTVGSNFTIDGSGGLNDLGATTVFNGTTEQIISGTAGTVRFYNITVLNTDSQVRSEMSIELINTLKLEANSTIDVDGTADDRSFTLLSDANGTARIAAIEAGATLNGQITMQRYIPDEWYGWRFVGTPIKGQTVNDWADDVLITGVPGGPTYNNFESIGIYTESLGTEGEDGLDGWTNYASMGSPVNVGEGNEVYIFDSEFSAGYAMLDNTGFPNIGDGADNTVGVSENDFSWNLSFTPTAFEGGGWNLLANPYPCELDWNSTDFVKPDIQGNAMYIWNPAIRQYGNFNGLVSVNEVTQYLASSQSFWVKATGAGQTVSVNEQAKGYTSSNTFIREKAITNLLKLKMRSQKGYVDELAVHFYNDAENGFDRNYDALKLSAGWVNISTLVEQEELSINTMGQLRGARSARLRTLLYDYGNYSISFTDIESFVGNTKIVLRDTYLNKEIPVTPSTKYNYQVLQNVPETFADGRFELLFLEPVHLKIKDLTAQKGSETLVPVEVDKFEDITGSSFVIEWDETILDFVGLEDIGLSSVNNSNFDLTYVNEGRLTFNWSEGSNVPQKLSDGQAIFNIRFDVKGMAEQTSITFKEKATSVLGPDKVIMPFTTENSTLSITNSDMVSGNISTFSSVPVKNVTVTLKGNSDTATGITNENGTYAIEAFNDSQYTISADSPSQSSIKDGVSILDMILTIRHLLLIDRFDSPYQYIAADLNNSGSVTALDLLEMQKIILGMNSQAKNWQFIPSEYDLSANPFGYQTAYTFSDISQNSVIDFVGVKAGDVNGSWQNTGSRKSDQNLTLLFNDLTLNEEIIEVPVKVSNFNNLSGYQFTLNWDPAVLNLVDVKNADLEGFFNVENSDEGMISSIWNEANGKHISLEEGATIFTLKFRVVDKYATSKFGVTSALTSAVAYDNNLNEVDIRAESIPVGYNELLGKRAELHQNFPNPFNEETEIRFDLPVKGTAKITIMNLLGEIVFEDERTYEAGENSLIWNRNNSMINTPSGIYLYRLESNGYEIVRKMIIQ